MSAKSWDYVVIGEGAASCVVAGRLSQMLPEARIALIEAGRERLGRRPGCRASRSSQYLSPAELELPSRASAGPERTQVIVVSGLHFRRLEYVELSAYSDTHEPTRPAPPIDDNWAPGFSHLLTA